MTLDRRVVLAVSGGADSMVMASLLCDMAPARVAAVATFDHGTGSASRDAAALVRDWATAVGVPVRVGQASDLPRTESAWRQARWRFLRTVAAEFESPVATAHTEDDQVETVFMRLLRHSGVRGLAGLLAPGPVLRPMLGLTREQVRAAAARAGVPFLDDPSNTDVRHLRNRVRRELLPRLERESPGFRAWLLSLGAAAATWRREVSEAVDTHWAPILQDEGMVLVPRPRGRVPSESEAALFWPEVAGRVGVALDWRGTARLASFTTKRISGKKMPLSGGVQVSSSREGWLLGPGRVAAAAAAPPNGWHRGTPDRALSSAESGKRTGG